MSAKIFIKGDYRHFFIDNSNITDYKVFYDNQYNNIQTKDAVVKSLGKNEKYVDNYVVKVFNNGVWIDLALLENYFNENEVRKSVFYRILTESNFEFNKRGISSTNIDMRLALNNLKIVCKINENFEFENSDCVVYDSKKAFLKKIDVYNRNLFYDEKNKDLFDSNQYAFFNKDNMSVDYRILTTLNEQIVLNNKSYFNDYTTFNDNGTLLNGSTIGTVDLLFKENSESLSSSSNVYADDKQLTADYYIKTLVDKQIVLNNKSDFNDYATFNNSITLLKGTTNEKVDLLFKENSESLSSSSNVYADDKQLTVDYCLKTLVDEQIVLNNESDFNDYITFNGNVTLLKGTNINE